MLKALFQWIAALFWLWGMLMGTCLAILLTLVYAGVLDYRLCIGLPGACTVMSIPADRPAPGRRV
ncbi:hypothetical protein [Pseudacidovorax intermedius]|uniref:hypothetical protein n=1 Tax=Pseudacidovorax intermedius TaxID=433924 RepID=UPI0026F30573|nr:hypothetical protein [Pseudacidovorax intermedius]